MLIDLGEVLKETGRELKFEGKVQLECPKEELDIEEPVDCRIDFVNAKDLVVADGRIKATVKMTCVRCLKDFSREMDLKISEQFGKEEAVREWMDEGRKTGKNEFEVPDEDDIYPISGDNKVDLSEVIRQELILNIPEKPLCSSSCKGLEEGKPVKRIDPRLEKLKELL